MSYENNETQKEVVEAQITEALLRMKKLNLHENAINEFKNERKLNLSEGYGALYWLNDEELKMVKDWEQETGNVVYHVIKNNLDFGLCYSFLYVSENVEEWEMDNDDLESGYPLVYVYNASFSDCSEFGAIGIAKSFGGLRRTA